jgi:hypothetical protein
VARLTAAKSTGNKVRNDEGEGVSHREASTLILEESVRFREASGSPRCSVKTLISSRSNISCASSPLEIHWSQWSEIGCDAGAKLKDMIYEDFVRFMTCDVAGLSQSTIAQSDRINC